MTTEYGVSYINKPKAEQTALPSKYPQGYFKDKPCRECGKVFSLKHLVSYTAAINVKISQ